jgi:hypothetical protein
MLEGVTYMILSVASLRTGLALQTIRNDLTRYHDRFDPPRYQRRPGGSWARRLVTERDIQTLRDLHPFLSSHK